MRALGNARRVVRKRPADGQEALAGAYRLSLCHHDTVEALPPEVANLMHSNDSWLAISWGNGKIIPAPCHRSAAVLLAVLAVVAWVCLPVPPEGW
jgi:hypothetical protein